jgi:ATP-dependent RNA helicase MSS116, mitochondrial
VLAKARTGTGKTLAFLIPSVNRLLQARELHGISVLIISPTRELAIQIADEATRLVSLSNGRIRVQTVVGGTNVKSDLSKMRRRMPNILVATPGRLNDLLYNYHLDSAFAGTKLQSLIMDEADQLLEMGFRPGMLCCCGGS